MGASLTGWLLVLAAGCAGRPAPAPPPQTFAWTSPSAAVVTVEVGTPVSGAWSAHGLSAFVPSGWTGETGPPGSALLLRVTEPTTESVVELWRYPLSGRPSIRPRPGCEPLFDDPGRFRAVPLLGASASHSCVLEDQTLVQGWYGVANGEEVHVEVLLPPGEGFRGRERVEPFLRGLAATGE